MQEAQGSILGLERASAGGNGNPLQYSGLGNSMDRGAPHAAVSVQRSHKKEERGNITIKPTDMKKILRGYCGIEFCVLQIHKLMP